MSVDTEQTGGSGRSGGGLFVNGSLTVMTALFATALLVNESPAQRQAYAYSPEKVVKVDWPQAPVDLDFLQVERTLARFVKSQDDLDTRSHQEYLWQVVVAMTEAVEQSGRTEETVARASFLVGQALPGHDGDVLSAFFPYATRCLDYRRRFVAMPWFKQSETAETVLIRHTAGDHLQQLCLAEAPLSLPPSEESAMMRFSVVRQLILQRDDLGEDEQATMLAQLFETAFSGNAP